MSTTETITDNPERSSLEQTWMDMGREMWMTGLRAQLNGEDDAEQVAEEEPVKDKEDRKLKDVSQWFTFAVAFTAAASVLAAAMSRWVPLALYQDFIPYKFVGIGMILVLSVASVALAAFAVLLMFRGIREGLDGWRFGGALILLGLVTVCMVVGVAIETSAKLADNLDEIRENISVEGK